MSAGNPCFDRLPDEFMEGGSTMREYLMRQSAALQREGLTEKQSNIRAAKEYREKLLDKMHNVYNQLGIEGYEERAKKTISSPKNKQDAIQEPSTTESVLRNEGVRGEGGLQTVEQGDQGEKTSSKEEVSPDYKKNIRDDYFAKADFFTPEEKEKFQTLAPEEQDKMIDNKRRELEGKPYPVAAVMEINGKTFEAENHPQAIEDAREAGGDVSKITDDVREAEGKFKLNDGEIIDRAQAAEMFDGKDHSEDLIPQTKSGASIILPSENKPPKVVPTKEPEPQKAEPPKEPPSQPPIGEPSTSPSNEWSAVRKSKLAEIEGAQKLFEDRKEVPWSETYDFALNDAQKEFPANNLYDSLKLKMQHFADKLDRGEIFNNTSRDVAAFNVLRALTDSKVKDIQGWDSDNPVMHDAAISEFKEHKDTLFGIARVVNPEGELGRALNILQSEAMFDPDAGLKIRRMELAEEKGEKLSDKEMQETADDWEKEKQLLKKIQEVKEKGMKEDFEKRLKELEKKYQAQSKKPSTEKPPNEKQKRENLLKQSGKDFADKIRAGKLKGGTYATIPGFPQAVNLVIEGIAQIVEKGATLAQAISDYARQNNVKDEKTFTNDFLGVLRNMEDKEELIGKIKNLADADGVKDVTRNMTAANFIRDYVNSHIGLHDTKDILDVAHNGLKEVLPDLTKNKLLEAYLKEGDFRPETKDNLESGISKSKKQLASIAKLEEDIADLKGYKELRQRSFPTERERDAYEKQLLQEKEGIIKDRHQKKVQAEKEYASLESERNRQLKKVQELADKKNKLEKGIIEKKAKRESEPDTPEIEKLKSEVKQIEKNIRDAESARKEAEKKIERDRNNQIKRDNQKLETERNRQLQRVQELTDKKNQLENGIREKREIIRKADTPEIEALKKQVEEADKNLREQEAALRKIDRDADRKTAQLAQYNTDIQRMKESGELLRKGKKKSEAQIDSDIAKKENELRQAMAEKGVKASSTDKYTKASQEQRAQSHNERIKSIADEVDKKLASGEFPEDAKKELTKLKGQLSAADIKLNENSRLSQEKTLDAGKHLLSVIKEGFKGDDSIRRKLQEAIDKFDKEKDELEQDLKLQHTKEQYKRDILESQRKIAAGEFEEPEPVRLKKSDAELVELESLRRFFEGAYDKKKREYFRNKRTTVKRLSEFGRAAQVLFLIRKFSTFANVTASAAIKPQLNAASKLTTGRIFDSLPFETTKAISERAKLGGESNSIETVKRAQMAVFKQMGEEKLKQMFQKANDAYQASDHRYQLAKGELESMPDKESKEYKQKEAEVSELKKENDKNLVDAVANSAYQFISGSSLEEAWNVLLHRTAKIDEVFGQFDKEGWLPMKEGEKFNAALENLTYVGNFITRSHAALKNFSSRAEFAAGFTARVEAAVAEGADLSRPEKILEIANESYLDWERGKYGESNWLSDKWNELTKAVDKVSPEFAFLMKADVAITRVPVNMAKEAILEYTAGAFIGSYKAWKAYNEAKGKTLNLGFTDQQGEEFKAELKKQLRELDPKEAATIARAFRKGGFGLGLYALAAIGGVAFGGFPHLGMTKEDKEKKRRAAETGTPELMTQEIKIGNYTLPLWASKIVEHTPAFAPALHGLGMAQVYKNSVMSGESSANSAKEALMASVDHTVSTLPQIQNFALPIAKNVSDRFTNISWDDVDKNGEPIKRKPFEAKDYLKILPFTDKKELLSDSYFKEAQNIIKSEKAQVSAVEIDKNLSAEEKKSKIKKIREDSQKEIDDIYKKNKTEPQ